MVIYLTKKCMFFSHFNFYLFYNACWGCGDGFEKRMKNKKNRMKSRMLRLITKSIKKQGYIVVSSNESADFDLNVKFSHSVWEWSEYYINDESQHHADIKLVNKLNRSISSLYARNIYYGRTTSNYSTFKTAVRKAFKNSQLPYCY